MFKKTILLFLVCEIIVCSSCMNKSSDESSPTLAAESMSCTESESSAESGFSIPKDQKEVNIVPASAMVAHLSLREIAKGIVFKFPYICYGTIAGFGETAISEIPPNYYYHEVIVDVDQWIKGDEGDQFIYRAWGGETDEAIYQYEDFTGYPEEPIGAKVLVITTEDHFACPAELIMLPDENGIVHADPNLMVNGKFEAVDIAIDDLIELIRSYLE